MVVGDVINDAFSLATATALNFQPAAGVEIIITQVGHEVTTTVNDAFFFIYDGVNAAVIYVNFQQVQYDLRSHIRAGITNTNHFRIFNADGVARQFAYSGIQIN